ncbi:MAG: M48 family metalloprotease [Prevotella sp.]|nr:M48 family metalloprotease [Staphylococcus sp.]MCM1350061.1 M48 family metalloprotease [Prevotella sp.]
MNKQHKTLAIILAFSSSIILLGGTYILGILVGHQFNIDMNIWKILIIINILLMLLFLFNFQRAKRYNRQLQEINGEEILSRVLERKDEALQNFEKNYKRMITNYKKVCIYVMVFYIFQILLIFINGFAFKVFYHLKEVEVAGLYISIIGALLLILIGAGNRIFYALFMNLLDKGPSQTKYPLTYQFIKDIFEEEGIKKEIEITIIDEVNVGILECNDRIIISIGNLILKFFTKEEIRAIIYHEIAHYKQDYTKLSKVKMKCINLLKILLPQNIYLFVYPKMGLILFDNEILEQSISIAYETKADDEVLNKNVGDAFARGAIKIFGLSYAYKIPRCDIEYALSKKHQWDDEVIQQYFEGYLSFYNQHQDFFIFASKNHLESRLPTHPNVKQRVEKFASGEVDPTIQPSNYFDADIQLFYREVNQKVLENEKVEVFDHFIETYDQYAARKKLAIASNFDIEISEVQSLMDEAYQYGEMEFAKSCAIKVLDTAKDNSRANLILGLVLAFYEFSDECIPHLQLVFEEKNSHFASNAFQALGEYSSITGKLELRNELRESAASMYDTQQVLGDVLQLNTTDNLHVFTNDEVINQIIEIAKENEEIVEICIGTKQKGNIFCHHVILFFQEDVQDRKKFEETEGKIWAYLDLEKEQYRLNVIPLKAIGSAHKFRKKPFNVYKR